MTQTRDWFYLTLFMVLLFTSLGTLVTSCTTLNRPAQQQKISTTSDTVSTSDVAVSQIDLDRDGTISAQEKQLLLDTQPDVNLTFTVIMLLVLLISGACAWASRSTPRPDGTTGKIRRVLNTWATGASSKNADKHQDE